MIEITLLTIMKNIEAIILIIIVYFNLKVKHAVIINIILIFPIFIIY